MLAVKPTASNDVRRLLTTELVAQRGKGRTTRYVANESLRSELRRHLEDVSPVRGRDLTGGPFIGWRRQGWDNGVSRAMSRTAQFCAEVRPWEIISCASAKPERPTNEYLRNRRPEVRILSGALEGCLPKNAARKRRLLSRSRRCVVQLTVYGGSQMTESQSSEVEKVLLYVSDARGRAKRAADEVQKDGAEPHIVAALRETENELEALHRKLAQGTLYAITDSSLTLAI